MWDSMAVLMVMVMCLIVRHACAATIGESCLSDSDCSVAYSQCTMQYKDCDAGICTCGTGYYPHDNGECHLESQMGEACLIDEDCSSTTVNSICEKDSMTCACKDGELFEEIDGVLACYKSASGTPCKTNDDCLTYQLDRAHGRCVIPDGAVDGTCGCVESLYLKGEQCIPANYGISCGDGVVVVECIGNTECTHIGDEHWYCLCPDESISYFNVGHDQCIHYEATMKLHHGEPCDNAYLEPDGRMCSLYYNLTCSQCPGTDENICLEAIQPADGGVSSATYSSIVLTMITMISLSIFC